MDSLRRRFQEAAAWLRAGAHRMGAALSFAARWLAFQVLRTPRRLRKGWVLLQLMLGYVLLTKVLPGERPFRSAGPEGMDHPALQSLLTAQGIAELKERMVPVLGLDAGTVADFLWTPRPGTYRLRLWVIRRAMREGLRHLVAGKPEHEAQIHRLLTQFRFQYHTAPRPGRAGKASA